MKEVHQIVDAITAAMTVIATSAVTVTVIVEIVAIEVATVTVIVAIVVIEAESARSLSLKMMFYSQSAACSISSKTTHLFAPVDTFLVQTMSMSHSPKYVATDYVRAMS
jgi:hypothetical protein